MEHSDEVNSQPSPAAWLNEAEVSRPDQARTYNAVIPQHGTGGCTCGKSGGKCSCGSGSAPASFVYALGRIEARFPRLDIEKEFRQATGRTDATSLTDPQTFHTVLAEPQNRYLARRMCYVLKVEGVETYLLVPSDPIDLDLLIAAIRPTPTWQDLDCVIGVRGEIAPPTMCNGLQVPIVVCEQVYSFDRETLLKSCPPPADLSEDKADAFRRASEEVFDRLIGMADNAGATDEHRALNYLSVRYPAIYAMALGAFERNLALSSVEVRPSTLSGVRRIVEVIFSFIHRTTDVTEKHFTRVDVTEVFPFLVTKLGPYFDR